MADAMKCDRCQNYYDEYKTGVRTTPRGSTSYVNRVKLGDRLNVYCGYDLCPNCMKELFDFLRIPYELRKERTEDA